MLALSSVLAGGSCLPTTPPTDTGPLFCDVEEARRFTQEEIDWRSANAPWNLRRDLSTNETGAEHCGWQG